MMYKPLPVVERLNAMEDSYERDKSRRALLEELVRTDGFQLVLEVLRSIESESIKSLQSGTQRPDLDLGRIQAVDQVRTSIRWLAQSHDMADDLALDDDLAYREFHSGFLEGDTNDGT